jgi:hypothetical protein
MNESKAARIFCMFLRVLSSSRKDKMITRKGRMRKNTINFPDFILFIGDWVMECSSKSIHERLKIIHNIVDCIKNTTIYELNPFTVSGKFLILCPV